MPFLIRPPSYAAPFGVIASGCFIRQGATHDNSFRYSRTGPFVPPIMFPSVNKVLFRNDLKEQVSNAVGAQIRAMCMENTKWVRSSWEGEDSDFLVSRLNIPLNGVEFLEDSDHDERLSQTMLPIWEIDPVALITAVARKDRKSSTTSEIVSVDEKLEPGLDLFKLKFGKQFGSYLVFSDRLWNTLEDFDLSAWCIASEVDMQD